ncbi:O-antigen ligase domain-containing protein [Sporolactobacillus sp. THM7-7]|nr:O-antigen ligase domain-containing protein [Sporolactobacillus sp. THM7-7]
MHIKHRVVLTTGVLAVLLTGFIVLLSIESRPLQWFFSFVWVWALWIACLFIKRSVRRSELLDSILYLFIASTFLNQSLLSIHVGFFTLFIYRLILILALFIFIYHAIRQRGLFGEWERIRVKGILYFLLFWMAYGSVSLLWSRSVIDGVKYLFLLGIGVAFIFLAVFTLAEINRLSVFYNIWMIMTAVLLVIGLMNHFARIQLPTSTLYDGPDYKLAYPTAVFTNQNDFATFLTISFFLYVSAVKNSRTFWVRVGALIAAGISAYIIYLTESRASFIGIALGLAFYFFLLLPPLLKKWTAACGIVGLAVGAIVFSDRVIGKIAGLVAPSVSSGAPSSSNVIRGNLLQNTMHYVADSFGFGVGAGNLPYYLKNEPLYPTNQIYDVHNWLAEILGHFGLMIALGYVAMYVFLFFSLYKIYKLPIGSNRKKLIEALLPALAAFAVSSISPSSVSNLYFHWVFLGLVISSVSALKYETEEKGGTVETSDVLLRSAT